MHSTPRPCFARALRAALVVLTSAVPVASRADPSINVPVIVESGEQSQPVMASDGAGGAILVWQDFRSGEADLYAQRIGTDGTPQWASGGVPVCTATGFQTVPRIVSDGAGGAIIVWIDYRSVDGDVYAQRLAPGGQRLWAVNGAALCDDTEPQLGVEIVPDGAGGAIAVWEDFRASAAGDLYGQRISAAGHTVWTANGIVVSDAPGAQSDPAPAADGLGGTIVVWRDHGANPDGDLHAQKISSGGELAWDAGGVTVCNAPGAQYDVQVVADGSYGAVVVWADERDTFLPIIYAQRLGPTGVSLWTANGVAAAPDDAFQLFPVAATDGAGGIIIAWEDSRSGTTVDVYGQRLRADGARMWGAAGLRLCDANGYESVPALTADGAGGAVIVWQDERGGADDLYAQRVTPAGSREWGPVGTPVSTASGAQLMPALVMDGSGGALFSWCDDRGADPDIYADHIAGGSSNVGVRPATAGATLQLAPPSPNPARGAVRLAFRTPEEGPVRIDIYDAAGRSVLAVDAGWLPAGPHTTTLDLGAMVRPAAGVHFVRVTAGARSAVTRLIVLP